MSGLPPFLTMFRVAKHLLPALWWIYFIIFNKITCKGRSSGEKCRSDFENGVLGFYNKSLSDLLATLNGAMVYSQRDLVFS